MALRGKAPEPNTRKRSKFLLFSLAGVGKTKASIQMPKPYIIDTENGTIHYEDEIAALGGMIYRTQSMDDVINEVKELMTTKHDYRTLVIDSFTPIYEAKVEEGAGLKNVGDSYGKHIAYADRFAKHLFRLLTELDMNVVVTSHAKDEYVDGTKVGIKFDGWKKLDYLFDLVLELERRKNGKRYAIVRKTRLAEFPDQESFEFSFQIFADKLGEENLQREAAQVNMASPAQVSRLESMIETLNISIEKTDKWLAKAEVDSFDQMTEETIKACIKHCEDKIATLAIVE